MVGLRLYEKLAPALSDKEYEIGRSIPASWYTYNTTEGEPIRIDNSYRGTVIPWSVKDCSWYVANKFQG